MHASVLPHPLEFGQHGEARIEILVDPARVNVDSLRVQAPLAPLTVLSSSRDQRSAAGLTRIELRYRVVCDTDVCLPATRPLPLPLADVKVTGRSSDDRLLRASARWPNVFVLSRLEQSDVGAPTPRFRVPDEAPPTSYRIAPTTLSRLLVAGGVVALLAGAALVATSLRRRQRPADQVALEQALLAVRQALGAEPPERRRALEQLARVLDRRRGVAGGEGVRALAWAPPAPEAPRMAALADEVERAEVAR